MYLHISMALKYGEDFLKLSFWNDTSSGLRHITLSTQGNDHCVYALKELGDTQ
jgi:hypothetical protein